MSHPITRADLAPFADHLHAWGRSNHTVKAYLSDMTLLMDAHPIIIPDVFADTAAAWLTRTSVSSSAATINRRLASFNAFARWRKVGGLQDYRRPVPTVDSTRMRCTVADIQRVMRHTTEFTPFALCALEGLAGLRVAEAAEITWSALEPDTTDETLAYVTVRGKGKKVRIVPIPKAHIDNMARRWTGDLVGPLFDITAEQARYVIRKTFRAHGFKVESHDLRRAFANAVWEQSHDIRALQLLLGHSDITTTQRYIGVSMETRAAIVKGIA